MTGSRFVAAGVGLGLLVGAVSAVVPGGPAAAHPENWLIAISGTLLGLRVIGYAPRNAAGWLLLIMGSAATVVVVAAVWPQSLLLAWIGIWLGWLAVGLLPALALLFPTGRPSSGRWLPILIMSLAGAGAVLLGLAWASWSEPVAFWSLTVAGNGPRGWPLGLIQFGLGCCLISLLAAVVSQILRWRRATGKQRRVLGWTVACTVLLLLEVVIALAAPGTASWAWMATAGALPNAAVIAITRYGLYDIDLLIHRSLLYAGLTIALIALYTASVLLVLEPLAEYGVAAHGVGAAVVVLAVAPLRHALQRRLDHWLYGDRTNPYDALSRLGLTLENALAPAEVLPTVARSVAEALKLPYVAVFAGTGFAARQLAEHGHSKGWPQVRVPMTYRGTVVGELVAETRSPEEQLGPREHRLLADLARQTAAAARTVQLTQDLQQARERLVRAREEERLRIRRDLHDGIGPSLAGVRMQIDAARQLLDGPDPRPGELLDRAVHHITTTSREVRDLVDGLRPPVLDLGLPAALREEAARFSGPQLTVDVTGGTELGLLPAAVEVAAYRIAAEALTNVARHSGAQHCRILLVRRDADLELDIVDDGQGIQHAATRGIGIASMHERCAELGGSCSVTAARPRGTRIFACLPLSTAEPVSVQPAADMQPATGFAD